MNIHSGQVINRTKFTPVPITQAVINAVNGRGKRDGMKKTLKVTGRLEHPIVRADWIAGVDHELHENDDSDSDDSDYSSEEESDDEDSDTESEDELEDLSLIHI